MEITKDNYFNVEYNKCKNVLEMKNNKKKNVLKRHKFITGVISATVILVMINILLIYKFFAILFTI